MIEICAKMFAIRYKGKMYVIRKGPHETDERACDRAWFVAKQEPTNNDELAVAIDESHKWCNEKYLGMKYSSVV